MTCKATWQHHADPQERLRGADADMWCGRVAGPRESTRTPGGMSSDRLAIDGPTGIVGLGESIGVVKQRLRGALPFLPDDLHLFSPCWTMFPLIFSLHDMW